MCFWTEKFNKVLALYFFMGFWDNFVEAFMNAWNSFVSLFDKPKKEVDKLEELVNITLGSFKIGEVDFPRFENPKVLVVNNVELKNLTDDQYLEVFMGRKSFFVKTMGKEVVIWLREGSEAFVGELKKLFYVTSVKKGREITFTAKEGFVKKSGKYGTQGLLLPQNVMTVVKGGKTKLAECAITKITGIKLYQAQPAVA